MSATAASCELSRKCAQQPERVIGSVRVYGDEVFWFRFWSSFSASQRANGPVGSSSASASETALSEVSDLSHDVASDT